MREYICCCERRYSVDFDSPNTKEILAGLMQRVEIIAQTLDRIAAVGRQYGFPIRILVPHTHLASHYFVREYVQALASRQDIAVIHALNAYENYFSNFGSDYATTLAVQDLTTHPELTAAYYPPKEWFESYFQSLPDREALVEQVRSTVRQHRVQRQADRSGAKRLAFLQAERSRGKKVVALLGKVLFDLGMPRGDGRAHGSMQEWFDHAVEIAGKNDHLHLVIKPHPHELRDEIALYPTEVLRDWLPQSLPANVHFLGHDELNLFELTDVLDLALLWNGTAALELGVLEIPTIMGAYYGSIDYPVGHIQAESREQFEELLVRREPIPVPEDVKYRSAALIHYLRHPDISIPYRYTYRGLTNKSIRTLRWFDEDLDAYFARGDSNVTRIADRIIGAARSGDALSPG
jgi:capsular polysaccharide export protein